MFHFLCPCLIIGIFKKESRIEEHYLLVMHAADLSASYWLVRGLLCSHLCRSWQSTLTVSWKSDWLVSVSPRMNYLKKLKMKSSMKLSVWARLHQNIGEYLTFSQRLYYVNYKEILKFRLIKQWFIVALAHLPKHRQEHKSI